MTLEDPTRPRSLHLSAADRTAVRDAAAAAGKGISEYVLGLAAAYAAGRHPRVLTADEQAELRDGLRELGGRLLPGEADSTGAGPAGSPGVRGGGR